MRQVHGADVPESQPPVVRLEPRVVLGAVEPQPAAARGRGLLSLGAVAEPETLLDLVLEPGFSTASSVDILSGRGFGLSVVEQLPIEI